MAIEQLFVRLHLDAQQYKREARSAAQSTGQISQSAKTAGTETGKIGGQMSGVAATAKFALAGVATAAVVSFAKDSINAATDLKESINAINVVFGESADEILAIGDNAADSFGLAKSEFNQFAVRFSNFAETIARESGEEVPRVIEDLTGRISDFASVINIDVPEAAEKFQSALAGQSRPIAEYGIDVREAAVKQKALELGIIDTGESLTQSQKEFVRYRILMDKTDKMAGDFKNTQDDLANATRTLNSNLTEFKALLGGLGAESLAEFAGTANDLLTIFSGIGDVLGGDAAGIGGFVTTIIDSLPGFGQFRDIVGFVADLFGESEEAAESAGEAVDEFGRASGSSAGEVDVLAGATDDVTEAFEGTELAAQDAALAIEAYDNAFRRLTDPVFRALDDQRRLADAFANYETVAGDAEATTADVEEALFGLLEAQQEANSSGAALPETMKRSEEAMAELASQLGLTTEDLEIIEEALNNLDGKTARANVEVLFRAGGSQAAMDAVSSGEGTFSGNRFSFAEGGRPPVGIASLVGERGPELFIPDRPGTVISNADIKQLIAGLTNTSTHNYNIPITSTGNSNADAQLIGAVASVLRRMETI